MNLNERQVGEVSLLDLSGRLVLDDGDGMLRIASTISSSRTGEDRRQPSRGHLYRQLRPGRPHRQAGELAEQRRRSQTAPPLTSQPPGLRNLQARKRVRDVRFEPAAIASFLDSTGRPMNICTPTPKPNAWRHCAVTAFSTRNRSGRSTTWPFWRPNLRHADGAHHARRRESPVVQGARRRHDCRDVARRLVLHARHPAARSVHRVRCVEDAVFATTRR